MRYDQQIRSIFMFYFMLLTNLFSNFQYSNSTIKHAYFFISLHFFFYNQYSWFFNSVIYLNYLCILERKPFINDSFVNAKLAKSFLRHFFIIVSEHFTYHFSWNILLLFCCNVLLNYQAPTSLPVNQQYIKKRCTNLLCQFFFYFAAYSLSKLKIIYIC